MNARTNCGIVGTVLTLALVAPAGAAAQTADAIPATPVTPASENAGDIVVTATRRAQNLQDVPVAVNVVSEQALRAQNIADTRDLTRLVPSLVFVGGATTKLYNFTIRGIGTYVFSDGFDQSVGVAFDGVPLARSGGSIADLVDIDRVEVLEGPQGMLFGKNASAGLINIITRAPQLGKTEALARISFGSFDELQTTGTVNLPLGTTAAVRASAWRFRHDGYVDAPRLGRKLGVKNSYGGRLRLRWQPSDTTDLNFTGEWTGADQDPSVTTIRTFATNALGVRDRETANGTPVGPKNLVNTSPTQLFNNAATSAYTAQIDQEFGNHTLTSVTSYRNIKVRENFDPESSDAPLYISIQGDNVRYKQFSQELRLTSPATQRLRYVLGAIYFRLDLKDDFDSELVGATPVFVSVIARTDLLSKHYAAFGEFTFDLTPELRLIAGGRLSRDRVEGAFDRVYQRPPQGIIPAVNGPGASFGPFSNQSSVKANEPSYRFGAQYDISDDIMLYATASRGYKAPGLDYQFTANATVAAITQFKVKPEIAHNYEVGLRTQLFDRRLTLNVTAFAERFEDFQIAVRLPVPAPIFSTENAAELRSTGIQGNFDLRLPSGLSFSGTAAYINARYTDFDNAACYPRQPVGTAPGPGLCVNGVQDLAGVALANSPKFSTNLTARYDVALPDGKPVFAQVNYRYQSKIVFNTVNDPFERQGGYGVWNVGAGIRTANERLGLSVYGKNVFKQNFVYRTVPQLTGAYYAQTVPYDARRTFGAALDVRF